MLLTFKPTAVLIEPQEDGLGHIFGLGTVPQGVAGHPVDRIPIPSGRLFKWFFLHGFASLAQA